MWTKTYEGSNGDIGADFDITSDNGVIITGRTGNNYSDSNNTRFSQALLIKTDSNGDTLWTKKFGSSGDNYGSSVKERVEGGYIIAGTTRNMSPWLFYTNESGDLIWEERYYFSGHFTSIQHAYDGDYVATGCSYDEYYTLCRNIKLLKFTNDTIPLVNTYGINKSKYFQVEFYNKRLSVPYHMEYSINLYNTKGEIIFQDRNNCAKVYDFSYLKDGVYLIILKINNEMIVRRMMFL
jgi:hypothetical protein